MRNFWLTVSLMLLTVAAVAEEQDEPQYVIVAEPYIEMHTGPRASFPVTQVIERGDEVAILKRRTDWFLVRSSRGYEGWVFVDELQKTLQPTSGGLVDIPSATFEQYGKRRWEVGSSVGDFDGGDSLSVYGAYKFSKHLAAEVEVGQVFDDNVDGWIGTVAISHTFVPEWRASPFFLLGTGIIDVDPKSNLIDDGDDGDQVALVGVGFKVYLTRRFLFRADYKSYVILDSDDDNEDVKEWKAGFAVFF